MNDSAGHEATSAVPVDLVDKTPAFDFDNHERAAIEAYRRLAKEYEELADVVADVLDTALRERGLIPHSVEARGKDESSFGKKARTPNEDDPSQPKYDDPISQISDMAGARVITFFLDQVKTVDEIIRQEFHVIEHSDKNDLLEKEDRLGYQSVHYLVRFKENRTKLPEYARFQWRVAEVQVRTILQHAWAEIEHDIKYKSVSALPSTVQRRFLALAGLIEIADREFQAIDHDHAELREAARASVAAGELDTVEITADSLRAYLDGRLSPDGRMSDWNYGYYTRLLHRMGFKTLSEVDRCIQSYDDDKVSRSVWGGRQGQLQRFEDMLLASMGQKFLDRHPWSDDPRMINYFDTRQGHLERLRITGIPIGHFAPEDERVEASS